MVEGEQRYAVVCPQCGVLRSYPPTTWKTAEEMARSSLPGWEQSHGSHGELRVVPDGPAAQSDDDLSQWLTYLAPKQREDFEAVRLEGVPIAVQARRRDVDPATVSKSVRTARERLERVAREHGGGDGAE